MRSAGLTPELGVPAGVLVAAASTCTVRCRAGLILITLLGGMGTFAGPVIGVFTIIGLQNLLADRVARGSR